MLRLPPCITQARVRLARFLASLTPLLRAWAPRPTPVLVPVPVRIERRPAGRPGSPRRHHD